MWNACAMTPEWQRNNRRVRFESEAIISLSAHTHTNSHSHALQLRFAPANAGLQLNLILVYTPDLPTGSRSRIEHTQPFLCPLYCRWMIMNCTSVYEHLNKKNCFATRLLSLFIALHRNSQFHLFSRSFCHRERTSFSVSCSFSALEEIRSSSVIYRTLPVASTQNCQWAAQSVRLFIDSPLSHDQFIHSFHLRFFAAFAGNRRNQGSTKCTQMNVKINWTEPKEKVKTKIKRKFLVVGVASSLGSVTFGAPSFAVN